MVNNRKIKHIVGVDENFCIGRGSELLFRISEDLQHFKATTMGHTIAMGRKTHQSVGALPGRDCIVITRNKDYVAEGCTVVHSIEEALEIADPNKDVFFIGGGEVYKQTIDICDELVITHIDDSREGDVFYPNPVEHGFKIKNQKFPQVSAKGNISFQVAYWKKTA